MPMGDISDDVGHSFWQLEIDEVHETLIPDYLRFYVNRPLGFYPAESGLFGVKGSIEDESEGNRTHYANFGESGRAGLAKHTWHITVVDCVSGLRRVKEMEQADYDLAFKNCTDMVREIGHAADVDVPNASYVDLKSALRSNLAGQLEVSLLDWFERNVVDVNSTVEGPFSSPLYLYLQLVYLNLTRGEEE